MQRPFRLAAIAFLFHGPGLRVFTDYRFSKDLFRINLFALALTIAVTGAAAMLAAHRVAAAIAAFTIGHFCWSAYLAWSVSRPA